MSDMMHQDQLPISAEQVAALIVDQLPHLAGQQIVRVLSPGTVNAIFRIGPHYAARFPLRPEPLEQALRTLQSEADAASEFASISPFPAPTPVSIGAPGHGYPLPWSVQTWIDGDIGSPTLCATSTDFARDLAALLADLRDADTRGRSFCGSNRGGDLQAHDRWVHHCIERSQQLYDRGTLTQMWTQFRQLPREDPDVMTHGDLIPGNVLVRNQRLVGVLDTGGFMAADPALDLVSAWHFLDAGPRDTLRRTLGVGDLQWERGKAWAFEQALGLVWYYVETNQPAAQLGASTLNRLLTDA